MSLATREEGGLGGDVGMDEPVLGGPGLYLEELLYFSVASDVEAAGNVLARGFEVAVVVGLSDTGETDLEISLSVKTPWAGRDVEMTSLGPVSINLLVDGWSIFRISPWSLGDLRRADGDPECVDSV